MPRTKTISDDDLLAAARAVFVELGWSVPTKEIARRLGVSEALLFQRFPTKEDLFFAAMTPPAGGLEPLLARVAEHGERADAIEALGLALVDYFRRAQPVLDPLMSHPSFRFEEFAQRHPDSPVIALRWQLVKFFQANDARDPQAAALLMMGVTWSIAAFERMGAHGGEMPRAIVQRALAVLASA